MESKEQEKKQEQDLTVILSYVGILFIVPLTMRKKDSFAQFHAKQGLVLCLTEMIIASISWIPVIGWFIGVVGVITSLILGVKGIMNVMNHKQEELPLIGQFAEKFKF